MYFVYVLRSKKDNKNYIGYTRNLEQRISEHNREKSRSLRGRAPFELIYREPCRSKIEATNRERQIKKYKGGEAFKRLIKSYKSPSSSLA